MAERVMTKAQEEHIALVIKVFETLADHKYRKGQLEHGGNLWDLSVSQMIDNALEEAIDQVIYLVTVKCRLMSPNPSLGPGPTANERK